MSEVKISAEPRTEFGKGGARRTRRAGKVPAVLYGHGEAPRPLAVDAHDLGLLMGAVNVENTLVRLEIEGERPQDVLVRDVQMHAYKPEVLHVDFFHVHAGEKVHVKIPVRLSGTPVGVHTHGGVLDQVLYDLEVECLPGDIPDAVEIDVSNMDLGESVRVGEVPRREGVRFLQGDDLAIASVVGTARAEAEAAAEEAPPEPEVVRGRKAEEEGEA